MTAISEKIRENALRLQERLVSINNVLLYYPGTVSGIVTFHTPFDSEVIKEFLWAPNTVGKRFEVSVVPATSTPLDSARTKVKNLVRTSVSYTTTADEIEALGVRLEEVLSSTPSWG
jgi:selenocysteine lyase/cysteine desulfurase